MKPRKPRAEGSAGRTNAALSRLLCWGRRRGGQAMFLLASVLAHAGPVNSAVPPLSMDDCRLALADVPALSGDRAIQSRNPQRPLIGLGSGPRGQTYHDMAENLIELLNDGNDRDSPVLVNVETGGSLDNLSKLDSTFNMTLAFAQSDVLERAPANQRARLRWVMPLYLEEIHILARRDHGHLASLDGKRIVVSRQSSGSVYTAGRLLDLAGIRAQGGKPAELSPVEAVCEVLTGKSDAMVAVAGQPVRLFRDLGRLQHHTAAPLRSVHFLPVQASDLTRGRDPGVSAAFYEPAQISRSSYPWAFGEAAGAGTAADQVATVGVRALLMAYDFSARNSPDRISSCDALKAVTGALRNPANRARLCQVPNHPKWCQLTPNIAVPGWQPNACE